MIGMGVALQDMEMTAETKTFVPTGIEAVTVMTEGTVDETTIVTVNVTDATTTVVRDTMAGTEGLTEAVTATIDLPGDVTMMQWPSMALREEKEETAAEGEVDEAEVKGAAVKKGWVRLNAEVLLPQMPSLCQ